MITFQSRQKSLQTAGIIERKAHNIYTHVSVSKLRKRYLNISPKHKETLDSLCHLYYYLSEKLKALRSKLKKTDSFYADLIYGVQDERVGNCFEEACLAELIGKINGQKNIYVGNIFVKKENVENERKIDHSIAFITNKKIERGLEYHFKNKDAVIIDPWLGITDFADKYFTQLRHNFKKFFEEIPEQDFLEYLIGTESKSCKDFREGRKSSCQDIKFNIKLAHSLDLDKSKKKLYKSFFPELVIKKYKKIELPKTTKKRAIEK